MATAGVGGAHRSIPLRQLTPSLPIRLVATVVAGGAVAATGQHVLAEALPAAADGAHVLRLGVNEILGSGSQVQAATVGAPLAVGPLAAVGPVAPEPVVADAAALIKAADLQSAAAEAATRTEQAEAATRAAEQAKAAEAKLAKEAAPTAGAAASVGGAVQMIVGRVTSGFGGRWGSVHNGLDIAAPIGTPIRAPLAGTVISSGPATGFGLWVRVQHADGTITVYGHINRSLVKVGQKVSAGQEIAEVGNRGESTGPHLHIEVHTPGGTIINPRPWLDQHGIGY
jgi:murein DD-endopeptidase MepM/ murein hydrolase activator NlpD